MKWLTFAGILVVSLAIGVCVLFGTLGWFAEGFGVMTDCTNNYSCYPTGCGSCAATGRWINAGGIAQWMLASVGVAMLVRAPRSKRRAWLPLGGVALLATSVLTMLGTTWLANESYCQPGSSGYTASYCSVDD